MLWVYDRYKMVSYFTAVIIIRRQILTSKYDPHTQVVKSIFKEKLTHFAKLSEKSGIGNMAVQMYQIRIKISGKLCPVVETLCHRMLSTLSIH